MARRPRGTFIEGIRVGWREVADEMHRQDLVSEHPGKRAGQGVDWHRRLKGTGQYIYFPKFFVSLMDKGYTSPLHQIIQQVQRDGLFGRTMRSYLGRPTEPPPVLLEWEDYAPTLFQIRNGNHRYMAALITGRETLPAFVSVDSFNAWAATQPNYDTLIV
jgi:hypothetical protein